MQHAIWYFLKCTTERTRNDPAFGEEAKPMAIRLTIIGDKLKWPGKTNHLIMLLGFVYRMIRGRYMQQGVSIIVGEIRIGTNVRIGTLQTSIRIFANNS
jgi:hypothetical protein